MFYSTPKKTEGEVFDDPLGNVGNNRCYARYKSFVLGGSEDDAYFIPHHNVYGRIWTAVRWGLYCDYRQQQAGEPFGKKRFILDLWEGRIVWQNFDDTKTETYKFKGIGTNYTTY